jgi:hypothetical protein
MCNKTDLATDENQKLHGRSRKRTPFALYFAHLFVPLQLKQTLKAIISQGEEESKRIILSTSDL